MVLKLEKRVDEHNELIPVCPFCKTKMDDLGTQSESLTFNQHGESTFLNIRTFNCLECGFIARFRDTEYKKKQEK